MKKLLLVIILLAPLFAFTQEYKLSFIDTGMGLEKAKGTVTVDESGVFALAKISGQDIPLSYDFSYLKLQVINSLENDDFKITQLSNPDKTVRAYLQINYKKPMMGSFIIEFKDEFSGSIFKNQLQFKPLSK